MKDRFAAFLVAKSKFILIIFILLALGCAALIPFVNINKDMTKYLPGDSSMRRGLDLMEAEFGHEESSELKIMFNDLKTGRQKEAMARDLETLPNASSVDYKAGDQDYNRGSHTLYIINCDHDQYSEEAAALWSEAQSRYEEDHEFALGGSIENANHSGLPLWIALSAVGLVFLVLLIMASSWIEPVAFLVTIGVAVSINMGSYVLFPSISNTTFGIVAILQLALSMDYSIMLLNRYRQQRQVTADKYEAMRSALSLSFGAITGSSLTTFAGLLALLFMNFGIGADIGLALAKGVLISLLCIFTVLPAMLLGLDGLMIRTAKRTLPFDLPRLSNVQHRLRIPLTCLFIGLLIAGFVAREGVDFTYAQYGPGDEIDAVFGQENTIVMMYSEKDSAAAGELAEELDERDDINSAVCYESSIGRQRSAEDMKDFIDDMADEEDTVSDTDLSGSMVRLIYYDYYSKDQEMKMSIPQFVDYLRYQVADDPDFGDAIDEETKDQIDDMAKFTNARKLTTSMNASSLGDFFGMRTSQAKQLLLYYQIKRGGADAGRMKLASFVDFLISDVASDPDYGSMIGKKQLKQLKSMQIYTDKKGMTEDLVWEDSAPILDMDADQMRLVYIMHLAAAGSDAQMTIAQFAAALQGMTEDPALAEQFSDPQVLQLIGALQQIGMMDPSPYDPAGMAQALARYQIPLDMQTLALVYAWQQIERDPQSHQMSVQEIVTYLLEDPVLSKSLPKDQKKQLKQLKKIIDTAVKGEKLSTSSMGKLLGMKRSDVRSIYLLRIYKYGNTGGWKLTPQHFIGFLVRDVLSDASMKKRIGGNASDLRFAKKLIDHSVAGTEFTPQGLADLLHEKSQDMSADDISMLYELYGSQERYDDGWTMDLMQLVYHLDDQMIERPAFGSYLEDEQVDDIHTMRSDLDEAAEKLHGDHYGRMMISADMEEDSDETRAFMKQLTAETDANFQSDTYLIGSTPMAYETSQTFHSELNRLTLLTALFILIIVLLTFRRLATPVILVLIIQCAVFMTMGFMNFLHVDMNYLALLIVQSIMMGATIDYAIIYSTYYIEHRGSLSPAEAIRASYRGSLQTILTSATILTAAVGLLSFAFSEPATRQICRILSVGCLIATILVIFLLPAILSCLDRFTGPRRQRSRQS